MQTLAIKTITLVVLAILALILALPTPPALTDSPGAGDGSDRSSKPVSLLRNARVWTGEGFSAPQNVVLSEGTIQAVEVPERAAAKDMLITSESLRAANDADRSDSSIIDAQGRYLLPGLIDAHVHTYGTALNDALRFGVTTQLDMFMDRSQLSDARTAREQRTAKTRADLFSAGMLATAPGGHGTQYGVTVEPLTAPGQASAWVAARQAEGSDYIKLVYIPGVEALPSLDRATARAVIEAAHAQGLMAVAHIGTQAAAREMIEDGIDGLVHVFADTPVTDAFIALAKEHGVFVIPTLTVIAALNGRDSIATQLSEADRQRLSTMQEQGLDTRFPGAPGGFDLVIALENVRRLHAGGVPILAGSDAPNPGTAHGPSLHQELQLLMEAGLEADEALAAATRVPAEIFGLEGRGVIAPGVRADLLLLENNPLDEMSHTTGIALILKNGYRVERDAGTGGNAAPLIDSELLGDFESGLQGPAGLAWGATDDSMTGGASTAAMERVAGGAGDSGWALRIEARVQPGFVWPWAGAGIMGRPVNIESYRALRFAVRGTPGSRRLMAFHENLVGAPPTVRFEVTGEWQTVTVPLAELDGANFRHFIGFAVVGGPEPGESTIFLDDVTLIQ